MGKRLKEVKRVKFVGFAGTCRGNVVWGIAPTPPTQGVSVFKMIEFRRYTPQKMGKDLTRTKFSVQRRGENDT